MRRLAFFVTVLMGLAVPAAAQAWTWPVDGAVLRPFVLGDDPYAGGQHRGIDVAGDLGGNVRAPAAGIVSFAGTVPMGGKTISIRTADGYTVTLLHLGAIGVHKSDAVGEGQTVATVGPSDLADRPQPYVYMGVRVTADGPARPAATRGGAGALATATSTANGVRITRCAGSVRASVSTVCGRTARDIRKEPTGWAVEPPSPP